MIKIGDKGKEVKEVQEWLNLHGISLAIDGDFGPATQYGVMQFNIHNNLSVEGIVTTETIDHLIHPMYMATNKCLFEKDETISDRVVEYAEKHLNQHPKEVGGENRGPWVRLYMDGYEGNNWPWCAGFVCYVLNQACGSEFEMPFIKSFSVDAIVKSAMIRNKFNRGVDTVYRKIVPGSFWVLRKEWGDWTHIGIVIEAKENVFIAIEGNTNDQGSREGIEVAKRIRGYKGKDFIIY